jgi:hypothetical protein
LGKIKETRKEKELLLKFQRLISGQKVRRRGEVEEEGSVCKQSVVRHSNKTPISFP